VALARMALPLVLFGVAQLLKRARSGIHISIGASKSTISSLRS